MKTQTQEFFTTSFLNQEEFLDFLRKENNAYSNFILARYFRTIPKFQKQEVQVHHIKPKHSNGCDSSWNLIFLFISEHAEAHKLLYECYRNYYDYSAWCLMTGKTSEGLTAMRKQNQLNMKTNQVGFYNPDLQRELGQRPKKQRQAYARNPFIQKALEKGFTLQSNKTNTKIVFQPMECNSLREIIEKWLAHPEMMEYQPIWLSCIKKEKFVLYTGLTRSLTGHRDKKTNKAVYSIAGWRVLGLFL